MEVTGHVRVDNGVRYILNLAEGTASARTLNIPLDIQHRFAPYVDHVVWAELVVEDDLVIDDDLVKGVRDIRRTFISHSNQGEANTINDMGAVDCPEIEYWEHNLALPGEEITLYLLRKQEVWVSKHCLKEACLALTAPPMPKEADVALGSQGYVGQPAAILCDRSEGEYIVGKHSDGNEDGVCRFRDGSMIMGWDYYKLFGEKPADTTE